MNRDVVLKGKWGHEMGTPDIRPYETSIETAI